MFSADPQREARSDFHHLVHMFYHSAHPSEGFGIRVENDVIKCDGCSRHLIGDLIHLNMYAYRDIVGGNDYHPT